MAIPILAMIERTSRLLSPGMVTSSEIPRTAGRRTSSAFWNASFSVVVRFAIGSRGSFGSVMRVSTDFFNCNSPSFALVHATAAFELEWFGNHADRQRPALAGDLR